MAFEFTFTNYKQELQLINIQNRVECDLYSIIACIVRQAQNNEISLRDVSSRRTTAFSKFFKGKSGFPDFVIRTRDKNYNAACLGAIEVKYLDVNLDEKNNRKQLSGHISSYKKVLYTNGLEWRFYDRNNIKELWSVSLGKFNGNEFIWEEDCCWDKLYKNLMNINWFNR